MFARRTNVCQVGVLCLAGILAAVPLRGDEASQARMKRDVTFLASDEIEGRGVGTQGLDNAAVYIAKQFGVAGLEPGGPGGSFFQPFPVMSGSKLDGESTLVLDGPDGRRIALKSGTDFVVSGLSGPGVVSAPIVFAGFGVSAPHGGYDDYAGLDVKGKVVLALRRVPRWSDKAKPFDGPRKNQHAELANKQAMAAVNGAAALVLVNDASESKDDALIPFQTTARAISNFNLPFVQIRRKLADEICTSGTGKSLSDLEQGIDRDLKPRSAPLKGWTATLDVKVKRDTVTVKNIVGVLEGSGPLAQETLIVGAHYDHLGYGGKGSGSRAPDKKEIHHGADDNASGTTALMELARHFGAQKQRQGRRLVFIAFTAEESGLIGSRYYAKRAPLFSMKETAAMVNLDMVGRLRADPKTKKEKLLVEGVGTAKAFEPLIDKLNPGFQLAKKAGGNGPSDHDSFYNQNVPVIFLWTGIHEDYHKPSDTADKINVAGMDKIVTYVEKIVAGLATTPERPAYVAVASSFTVSPGTGKMPRLGIMPDYEEDKPGVLVSGVSKDGPAEKSGLKAGDRIVDVGGRPVTNITTYMAVMGQQRAGQAVEVTVDRDGKKLKLKVVPQ